MMVPEGFKSTADHPLYTGVCSQQNREREPMTMKWSHGNCLTPILAVKRLNCREDLEGFNCSITCTEE